MVSKFYLLSNRWYQNSKYLLLSCKKQEINLYKPEGIIILSFIVYDIEFGFNRSRDNSLGINNLFNICFKVLICIKDLKSVYLKF